jgi:hypothetical protein
MSSKAIVSEPHSRWRFDPRWALAIACLVLLVVLAVQAVTKSQSEWAGVYVRAASDLLAGRDIYGTHSGFLYPPFPAILGIPFLPFPEPVIRLLWYAINVAAVVGLGRWGWALAGGSTALAAGVSPRLRVAALVLGGLCGATYILNAMAHQQTDVIIAVLLVGGSLAVLKGRDDLGGAAIGLAIAFKATPLFFVPYLVWRGRYRAAAVASIVAVAVTLLPDVLHRSPNSALWAIEWLKLYAVPSHQSLAGLIQRALNLSVTFAPDYSAIIAVTPTLSIAASRMLLIGTFVVILVISWAAARTAQDGTRLGDPERPALEASLILVLMLLASPMSSVAHFATLLLPGLALARIAIRTGDRGVWAFLIVAGILALFPNKDLAGGWLYAHALWAGVVTWHTLALWAGCVYALTRRVGAVGAGASDLSSKSPS